MSYKIPTVVCIAGPTASGKSRFAVRLAHRVSGEVINADALQVYSDLRVISARPDLSEMEGIAHHLFGHVKGSHRYSAGQWLREASEVILDIMARGKTPIVVGGTGLYFKALTQGLAAVPHVSLGAARALLDENGIAALRRRAEELDPRAAAKVLGDDPHRLLRIVSVALETDKPLSEWRRKTKPVVPAGYYEPAVIMPARDVLYGRINARFDKMLDGGGLPEVKALVNQGLPLDLPVMRAIGVKTLAEHLRGERSLASGIELAKRDTRRFAKRQMTWFRGQAQEWPRLENSPDLEAFCAKLTSIHES